MAKILIIDDEDNIRASLSSALSKRGHQCVTADSFAQGSEFASLEYDIILLDVYLGDGSGLDLLANILKRRPSQCVVMISGQADIDMAVKAIQGGAYDFIEKPLSLDRILITIDNATRTSNLREEKNRLTSRIYGELVGNSKAIQQIKKEIARSASKAQQFLITGENGTGKEMVAHLVHQHSARSDGPFVAVNCAALPSELIESELFGHTKGAFTGATQDRKGRFVEANGGTIFLDEIGDMPLEAQAKILRVTETRQVQPVGADKTVAVDCNIIAATNRELEKSVKDGSFRQDLYYRLNVVTFAIPPLRQRPDDIVLLADYFLERFAVDSGSQAPQLSDDAREYLTRLTYPGNVRELKNIMERANIYREGDIITAAELSRLCPTPSTDSPRTLKDAVDEFERTHIQSTINRCGGNMTEAARELGIERSHLYKKMKKLGMQI